MLFHLCCSTHWILLLLLLLLQVHQYLGIS
jgi:hypothetical protein